MRAQAGMLAALFLTASCNNLAVTIEEGRIARREHVPELGQDGWVVRVRVSSSEYSMLRGGAYLFASDCRSYEPEIEVGSGIDATTAPRMADGGHVLRFVLHGNQPNQRISENWAANLRCVYVRTTHNYDVFKYRSNIVRLR